MTAGRVVVVGLGPAGPELLTDAARAALAGADVRFLRTTRHPAAAAVEGARSFDEVYEAADDLAEVYRRIATAVVDEALRGRIVAYAVPGSPLVAERTVELLRQDGRVPVDVVPALSFLDLAWARLGVDPLAAGVRLVDGQAFGVEAAGERGPLLVAQCDAPSVLSGVKLALDDGPVVTVLQRLGLPDERVVEVPWEDLDRPGVVEPDHLTSVWIPRLAAPVAPEVARFSELVRTLRERCPWDREQTHESLTRHLLEESYEVLEAIDALDPETGDGYEHLEEELGDLLFQVVFHTTLATEAGRFTLADVARTVHDKLVHRHPHVFGDVDAATPDAVVRNWEQIKKAEKGRDSVFDGISGNLPALLYAHKVLRKAASIGVEHEALDAADGTDVGELLLAVTELARRRDVDPETALRQAAAGLRERAMSVEGEHRN